MARLVWGAASDVGRLRSNNQDRWLTVPRVFAVADGMGGHNGGEVASTVALDVLADSYTDLSLTGLRGAAEVANEAVFRRAADDPELRGMGTTLVAIAPVQDESLGRESLAWINIGDSRLYRLRDGELEQISEDHSLVEEMVRDGRISADEARGHPQRNILTRALGIDGVALIDSGSIDPFVGDRYLLCSDGLFNEVEAPRIAATLRRIADPAEAAQELVRLALEGGGRDNITVVVVDVVDDDDAAAVASAGIDEETAEGHGDGSPSTSAVPVGTASDDTPGKHAEPEAKRIRPRRLTLRVVLFGLIVAGLLGAGAFAVYHQARSGYTVRQVGADVVIYKGDGNQVLWLKPDVVENAGEIPVVPRYQQAVHDGQHFGSLDQAKAYVRQLSTNDTTTTTTTTTLLPTGTTVLGATTTPTTVAN
jgi:serine/threonine protein phosphatase PrpC